MDLLQEIPGYRRILKTVLQLQIKLLVDQLAEQTGDECIVLVASIPDRTLCQLGTKHGENYLENKDELKTDFLQHCLQKLEVQRTGEKASENLTEKLQPSRKTDHMKKGSNSKISKHRGPHRKTIVEDSDINLEDEESYQPVRKKKKHSNDAKAKTVENKQSEVVENTVEIVTNEQIVNVPKTSAGRKTRQERITRKSKPSSRYSESVHDPENDSMHGLAKEKLGRLDVVEYNSGKLDLNADDDDYVDDDDEPEDTEEDMVTSNLQKEQEKVKEEHKFISGKALNQDLRTSLILQIIENGGDVTTGHVPRGVYTKVQKMFGVPATSSVTRIWERYVSDGTIAPKKGS